MNNEAAIILNQIQIDRLYRVVDTHHKILKSSYIGHNSFNVETDKRAFVFHTNDLTRDYILEGIVLTRD